MPLTFLESAPNPRKAELIVLVSRVTKNAKARRLFFCPELLNLLSFLYEPPF